jgi:hypothetical protein
MANLFTHQITAGYKNDSGSITSVTATYQDDTEIGEDMLVTGGSTNKEYDVAFTIANVKTCVLYSDKAVTIKTNSISSPQETITLAAGQQKLYTSDGLAGGTVPFSGNVTKFYISNAGTTDANVKFRALLHQGV